MTRCSGHCCKDFTLPFSPEELHRRQEIARQDQTEGRVVNQDWIKVPDLVIPLYGPHPAEAPHGPAGASVGEVMNPVQAAALSTRWHYTCKAHDPETGNCTVYETRPNMCRNYPYKDHCRFRECTWQGRRCTSEKLRVLP